MTFLPHNLRPRKYDVDVLLSPLSAVGCQWRADASTGPVWLMWQGSAFSEHLGKDECCDEMRSGVCVDDVAGIFTVMNSSML